MSDALSEAQAARAELHKSSYWPAAQRTKGTNRLWLVDVHLAAAIAALGVAPLPPPATKPYWLTDFEDGTLGAHLVKTSSGTIDVVTNPLTGTGRVLRLFTAVGAGGPNANSAMASAYANQNDPVSKANTYATEGLESWYRADLILPAEYRPSIGNWNWLTEWHVSDGVPQNDARYLGGGGVSCGMGVITDYKAAPNNPRLWVRLAGGDYTNRIEDTTEDHGASVPVTAGRAYKILHHFRWSRGGAGRPVPLYEWWVDGTLRWQSSSPNLFSKTDGSPDWAGFGVYNYHVVPAASVTDKSDWPITVCFDQVAVGPSRSSVGG